MCKKHIWYITVTSHFLFSFGIFNSIFDFLDAQGFTDSKLLLSRKDNGLLGAIFIYFDRYFPVFIGEYLLQFSFSLQFSQFKQNVITLVCHHVVGIDVLFFPLSFLNLVG